MKYTVFDHAKKRVIIVLIISLAFLIPASSAINEHYMTGSVIGRITSDNLSGDSAYFVFSGDNVLWENMYNQSATDGLYGGLYLYSFRDNSTRPVATETATGGKWMQWHSMSGNVVVWYEYPGVLHAYDISSGEERIIPDAKTKGAQKTYSRGGENDIERWMPFTYGDRVVWLQGLAAGTYNNADIVLFNLTTNEVVSVNESLSAKGGLAMNNERIVWYTHGEKRDGRETSIYLHDLATGVDTVVCSDPGLKTHTTVSGNFIAWTDSHDPLSYPVPRSQVRVYNISSRTTLTIPATGTDQYDPFFAGDYVVYTECSPYEKSAVRRSCASKLFDPLSGTVWQFPSSGNNRKILGFSNGRFLTEDSREGTRDFTLFTTDNMPLTRIIPATPNPIAEENVTTSAIPLQLPPSTPDSPGFDFPLIIIALFVIMGTVRELANGRIQI